MEHPLEVANRKRLGIRDDEGTDAFRLMDGAGDGIPGVEIEEFAGRWLVQTRDVPYPEHLIEPALAGKLTLPAPKSVYWKALGRHQSPVYVAGEKCEQPFESLENGLRYQIDFNAGYSQGIFLDQRENRLQVRRLCAARPGLKILNCFAYTCAFGIAAAAGGAETTNLDLSKRYLEWGKKNYELNGFSGPKHDFIFGDALQWLERLAKKGRRFDLVVLDPPTFSRDQKGSIFRIEENLPDLVGFAARMIEPGGFVFVSTNQRSLSPVAFRRLVKKPVATRRTEWIPGEMPPDFTGEPYLKSGFLRFEP